MSDRTLYERLGGEAAVTAAVGVFYEKVLADDRVARFFEGLSMKTQIDKQIGFMTWAFDGPSEYRGRDLKAAHSRLVRDMGLADEHFDAIAELLKATLEELEVGATEIDEALGIVATTRDAVLGRA